MIKFFHSKPKYRRLIKAGFLFFLLKGIAWLLLAWGLLKL